MAAMWETGITTDYLQGLGKQMFIKETILNGMFPCQSDFTKLLRNRKQNWSYHEFYEYRMLLANSNTGGSINSQLFNPSGSLRKPGNVDIGIFRATYGLVTDGFDIDMISNIETSDNAKAFLTDYARQLHSLRMNVSSIFKNVAIHGRFGWVHEILERNITVDLQNAFSADTPQAGIPFWIQTTSTTFTSGFARGRFLIKTTNERRDGPANVSEMYYILDNQPHRLRLVALPGSSPTQWAPGQHLELSDNRTFATGATYPDYYNIGDDTTDPLTWPVWTGTGSYTYNDPANNQWNAGTGFMQGLEDLLPSDIAWDAAHNTGTRIGLDAPFRGHANRLQYSTQMAGGYYVQGAGESIIDAIMGGVRLATLAVPYEELGVWMNHDTRLAIGAQEANDVRIFKQIAISQPIVFQRGVTATTYTVGSKEIPDTISDDNFRTDVVLIGPKLDMSYCTLDNAFMRIDDYVQNTFSKEAPPDPEKLTVPNELMTSLNIGKRFVVGSPTVGDGRVADGIFVHPAQRVPVVYNEMGSLFTEQPHAYVVVKLQHPIVNPAEAANW